MTVQPLRDDTRGHPTTLVLVDRQRLAREGLCRVLGNEFTIVGQAADGESAIDLVTHLAPDVVLIDVDLPGISGIETTRRIRFEAPNTRVLMFTADPGHVRDSVLAGACGYILRGARPDEISAAIRAAARGGSLLSPEVAATLIDAFRRTEELNGAPTREHPALTVRELQILRLITDGMDNHEIAERLEISTSTVKHHVSNILAKLEVKNRIQAAVSAIREQLL
jgi:DNA-binding NarL/FixJ family response regulator